VRSRRLCEKYDICEILGRLWEIADEKKPKVEGFFDFGPDALGKN